MQEKLNSHFHQVQNNSALQHKADGVRSIIGRVASDLKLSRTPSEGGFFEKVEMREWMTRVGSPKTPLRKARAFRTI
jgi:hypothetical protein